MAPPSSSSPAIFVAVLLVCGSLTAGLEQGVAATNGKQQARRSVSNFNIVEAPEAKQRIPAIPGRYLYPVLAWGPNNQVAGLKEALVLGKLMNRTVIVHDLLNHYGDKPHFEGDNDTAMPKAMDFGLVFDFEHLARHRSVLTLHEARGAGWDSRVQAVVHFGDKFLDQMKNARELNVSDEGAPYLDFERFKCDKDQFKNIVDELAEYDYIAVIVYENIVRDAGHGVKLRVTGELCHDEYLQVSAQLTKSGELVKLAKTFRQKTLGGRYVAVHIRPYPDTCLSVWRRREYNPQRASKLCKNRNLRSNFVNQTLRAMEKHAIFGLFVMCLPELRPVVSELYGEAKLTPVYYDLADLGKAVGYRSVSLLGMLEEEIAYEADVFIGTSFSSMSSIIMQERFARGKEPKFTTIFTRTS